MKKIRGYKNCVCCGKSYSYFNPRSVFCSRPCETKYRGKNRPTEVSLAYVPEHLSIGKDQGKSFFNWLKKVPEEPPQETMDDPRLADLAKKILEKQPNME